MRRSRRSDRAQPATKRPPGEGFQPSVRGIFFSRGSVIWGDCPSRSAVSCPFFRFMAIRTSVSCFFFALWPYGLPFHAFFFALGPRELPFQAFFFRLRPQTLPREGQFDPIRPQMLLFTSFGTSRMVITVLFMYSGASDSLLHTVTRFRDFPIS